MNKNKEVLRKAQMVIESFEENAFRVYKRSIQDVVIDASITDKEGGKMPIDTGFLRISGAASINTIPHGPDKGRARQPGEIGVLPEYSKPDIAGMLENVLIKLKPSDIFYFGWSARYAYFRELKNGFLESACQKWEDFVEKNFKEVNKGNFRGWSQHMNSKYGG